MTEIAVTKADDGRIDMETAPDLATALSKLQASKYDVIVLDLNLPDSNGMKSVTTLNNMYAETPIVVLSGDTDEMAVLRYLEGGVQEFLLKGQVTGQMVRQAIFIAMFRHSLKKKS